MPATVSPSQERAELRNRLVKEVVSEDITRPWQSGLYYWIASWRLEKLPPFNHWVADLMRFDQQVAFGLMIRSGPLMAATCTVEAEDEEIAAFVQTQWDRIWRSSARKILLTKVYGRCGFEVRYKYESDGLHVGIDKLMDLHPSMTYPILDRNEVVGIRVRPHGSFDYFWNSFLTRDREQPGTKGHTLLNPKCLWTTFQSRFGSPWGEPLLEKAYSAWWEKWMEHGAKRSCMLRMIKDAWIGDVFYYPPTLSVTIDDGTPNGKKLLWKDMLREIAENRLAGAALMLPRLLDDKGRDLVEYKPPTAIGGETSIFQWQELVNVEIWKGLGIPREVLEASGTGSGFSGRSIPFVAFINSCMEEFQEYVEEIKRQVLEPLVYLNFGQRPSFELVPIEASDLIQKLTGGASAAAIGGGGIGMGQPLMQMAAQQGMQAPRQFSEVVPADQRHLPTVRQIVTEAKVSEAAARRARVLVAQLSEDEAPQADKLLAAVGVQTDTAAINQSLDRLSDRLAARGRSMAYYTQPGDMVFDDDMEDDSPEQDEEDEMDDEEAEGAFDDDLGENNWESDDDEIESSEGDVDMLDDLSDQEGGDDENAMEVESGDGLDVEEGEEDEDEEDEE